jgi:hypothetical protein
MEVKKPKIRIGENDLNRGRKKMEWNLLNEKKIISREIFHFQKN